MPPRMPGAQPLPGRSREWRVPERYERAVPLRFGHIQLGTRVRFLKPKRSYALGLACLVNSFRELAFDFGKPFFGSRQAIVEAMDEQLVYLQPRFRSNSPIAECPQHVGFDLLHTFEHSLFEAV